VKKLIIFAVFLVGCSEAIATDGDIPDAADPYTDAAVGLPDATVDVDAGQPPEDGDAGVDSGPSDAGHDAGRDSGPTMVDSGADAGHDSGPADAGSDSGPPDAGPPDSGPPPFDRTAPVMLALGDEHSCLLRTSGNVHCWGYPAPPGPTMEPLVLGAVGLAASGGSTCAVLAGGAVTCWTSTRTTPSVPAMDVIATHCGITYSGGTTCWAPASAPPTPIPDAYAIDTYHDSTCVVRADRSTVTCWGGSPTTPGIFVSSISAVTVGGGHACVLAGSTVWCWGANARGQSGGLAPTMIGTGYAEIVAGDQHTCGRRSDGSVWCWGDNAHGQLGRSTRRTVFPFDDLGHSPNPGEVFLAGARMNAMTIDAGRDHTCAALVDGRIVCWGSNNNEQLGRWTPGGMSIEPVEPDSFWTE